MDGASLTPGRTLKLPQLLCMPHVSVLTQQSWVDKPASSPAPDKDSARHLHLPQCRRVLPSKITGVYKDCDQLKSLPPVSGHLLGWVLQPHDADICPQTHPLLHPHLQDEDELGGIGLGETSWCINTLRTLHLEWECASGPHQPTKSDRSVEAWSTDSHEGGEDLQIRGHVVGIIHPQ